MPIAHYNCSPQARRRRRCRGTPEPPPLNPTVYHFISPDRLNARTLTASTAASSLPRNSSAAAGTPMAPYSLPRMPAMLLAGAGGASPSRPGVVGCAATAADQSVALDQLWHWGSSIRWRRTDCSQQEHGGKTMHLLGIIIWFERFGCRAEPHRCQKRSSTLYPSRQSSMQAAVQVSREGTRADIMALSKLSATMHGGTLWDFSRF